MRLSSTLPRYSNVPLLTTFGFQHYQTCDSEVDHDRNFAPKGVHRPGDRSICIASSKLNSPDGASCQTWGLVFSSFFASWLRYREPDGILASRTRNPRLFAHVDCKELLVEYVEGENVGKALLLQVCAGHDLGEGYVLHAKNIHLRSSSKGDYQADVNTTPLIIMITSERVFAIRQRYCDRL